MEPTASRYQKKAHAPANGTVFVVIDEAVGEGVGAAAGVGAEGSVGAPLGAENPEAVSNLHEYKSPVILLRNVRLEEVVRWRDPEVGTGSHAVAPVAQIEVLFMQKAPQEFQDQLGGVPSMATALSAVGPFLHARLGGEQAHQSEF